ncbi:MAG: carboxypeptidase regulatory-like domain-containing protein [Gemmatimonadales bacterium]
MPARLLALLLFLAPGALSAQAGATTDILTGVVRTDDGRPVVEAMVSATSLETQITRTVRTDTRGRYVIVFPDGGGQYRLLVRAIGMAPQILNVMRHDDEDRLVTDVKVSPTPTRLADINVQARRAPPPGGQDAPGPGATERVLNVDQLQRLPLDASELALLASLAPGVVLTEASDSTLAGFSVAGQRPDANAVTLDGLLFGGAQVPPEAMRNARVITNTYDVSRGQFSGGLVSSTTRGGGNMVQGGFTYGLRDHELEFGEEETTGSFGQGFTQHQVSLGLGGPLIRDKLFFFGSGQIRTRNDALTALTTATPTSLSRLGVAADSVDRFRTLVSAAGLSPSLDAFGPNRDTDDLSLLGRLDWILSSNHTVMVRGDWRGNWQEPSRLGALALPQTSATNRSDGAGVMASLSSRFGTSFINELRAYGAENTREGKTDLLLPQGRVQVTSALETGEQSIATLSFGGNPGVPQYSRNRSLEISDELSWLAGSHRIKLGGLLVRSEAEQDQTQNRYGTFTYLSLADFEANRPSSFTRTLAPGRYESSTRNDAVYLSDTWRAGRGLQLTYGLRAEFGSLGGAPAYNPRVDELFGRRTDRFPSENQLSPRAGFSWMIGAGRPGQGPGFPALILRGGVGLFRSPLPTSLAGLARSATGLPNSEGQLFCVGDAAPAADWVAYLANPAAIPTSCAGAPGPSLVPERAPSVTVFSPGFRAPQSLRASLGGQRRLGGLGTINLDLTWARGRHQAASRDLNLAASPAFTLDNEGGRPVYAPSTTITPETGAVSLLASRRHPEFGQVLSLEDEFATSSLQATVAAQGVTSGGTVYNLSYTLARSRDQSSGGFGLGSGTTAGDPNVRDRSVSDFDRRHSFLATVTHPFNQGLELTAIARMSSGAPYTPRVGGDINADGSRNDRAFIFAPGSAPDTAIGNGMGRLLESTSGKARSCLESQLGRVAERNSCRSPWQPSLELQLNWRPNLFGLNRRLSVSVSTVNLLGGVDQLVNGADDLRGWGQAVRPDGTLLYVNGFDPNSRRFLYTVNERFGATGSRANAFRVPFQIGLQARYTIGPDRFRDAIRGLIGNRGGGAGAGRPGVPPGGGGAGARGDGPGGGPFARLENTLPNPPRQVLHIADTIALGLSPAQREKLGHAADSLDAEAKALAEEVRKDLANAGANPDMAALMARMRPRLEEARGRIEKAIELTRAALTEEQWARLPESIRLAAERMRAFGGGQRQQRRPPA